MTKVNVRLMRNMYGSDHERLLTQIILLRKRDNLNLAFGIVTTIFAAVLLVWMVVAQTTSFSDTKAVLAYYIPRVATIAFVETFSFFFLRLYKSTLDEEKFYQNEITSRTAWQTALEAALRSTDSAGMTRVITNLSLVDQNRRRTVEARGEVPDLKDVAKVIENAGKIISATVSKKIGAEE